MIDAAERERQKLALIVEGFDFECTGMDDHDSDDCKKCIAMRERLKVTLEKWGALCANEARLNEAQWWYDYFLGKPQSGKLGIERLAEPKDRLRALKAEG